jgi:SAM-dependent methyltransferase
MYYADKLETLKDLFGTEAVELRGESLAVGGRAYPILDDVILLLDPSLYPAAVRERLAAGDGRAAAAPAEFAEDIQFTFGEEWKTFSRIEPEHRREFEAYFDLVDLDRLKAARVCDLGCGIGRWGHFLKDHCRELVAVDFSEAIFVARENLRDAPHALFFMGDLRDLPFRDGFADLLYCLGVLHHLPGDALDKVRGLKRYAPNLLIYLYYALDNRPAHYRLLLGLATGLRRVTSRVRNPAFRASFTAAGAYLVYKPLVLLGAALAPLGVSHQVPLYEAYHGCSMRRIRQDVYDRFFTRIEDRFSRRQIRTLEDTFAKVTISPALPYWHFLCQREAGGGHDLLREGAEREGADPPGAGA